MISLNRVIFSFKIYFSFSFCSEFNLETTVVKADEIRGSKQLFTPCFPKIGKKCFSKRLIINNYCITHQKNHIKNNNDRTFNQQRPCETASKKWTESSCLHTVEKDAKMENVNKQNDYQTARKKWTDTKKTDLIFVYCKWV